MVQTATVPSLPSPSLSLPLPPSQKIQTNHKTKENCSATCLGTVPTDKEVFCVVYVGKGGLSKDY